MLAKLTEAAEAGIDLIQLREKDLPARDLEHLTGKCLKQVAGTCARLLVNSRLDIALACGAHGVHLPAHDLSVSEVRAICRQVGREMLISVSCHTPQEVASASAQGADYALFAPVFATPGKTATGIGALRQACLQAGTMPVLALGGVDLGNAADCLQAGAVGIAAIRLFQQQPITATVRALRQLG